MIATTIRAAFLLVVFGYFQAASATRCPPNFLEFQRTCYAIVESPLPFNEALTSCHSYGASLATPKSAEEENWINGELKKHKISMAWIGLYDEFSEGTFYWVGEATPLSGYTNWKKGEPNNYKGNEDCVHSWLRHGKYQWNDLDCTRKLAFVCQKRKSPGNQGRRVALCRG